jgi:hypothetical protein
VTDDPAESADLDANEIQGRAQRLRMLGTMC